MNRCPLCLAPVAYHGGRHARDLDGELHACELPALPRSLLCHCGALVVEYADGRRFDAHDLRGGLLAHEHMTGSEALSDEDPPHPADTDTPPPSRWSLPTMPEPLPADVSRGWSDDVILED